MLAYTVALLGAVAAPTPPPAAASPPAAEPSNLTSPMVSFRVAGVELDRALSEFRAVCLDQFPELPNIETAIANSSWNYERQISAERPDREEWRSPNGWAVRIGSGSLPTGAAVPQCNLDTAAVEPFDEAELVGKVEAILADELGMVPPRTQSGSSSSWSWSLGNGFEARLHWISARSEPRQISLSVQTWHPAYEASLMRAVRRAREKQQ